MTEFPEENLLMLSGIQHIAFCERQWALIHIEQQWSENLLTVEGHHLHDKADDQFAVETRGNTITLRAVPLVSYNLGLSGKADVLEFFRCDESLGISLKGREGKWLPHPVEYKRGKPKPDERDEVQLCAQAICLEEMYNIILEKGDLYYCETRHRHEVIFRDTLRKKVEAYVSRMHELFDKGLTPLPVYKARCKSCSLVDICIPKNMENARKVEEYLKLLLE